MNDYSSNPKITFAEIKLQDVLEAQNIAPDSDFDFIVKHREETVVKYQPIFSPEHIPFLRSPNFTISYFTVTIIIGIVYIVLENIWSKI